MRRTGQRTTWRPADGSKVLGALMAAALTAGLLPDALPASAHSGGARASVATTASGWTIERVSVTPDGQEADGDSWLPSISGDGSTVAFSSAATVFGPNPGAEWGLWVRDLATGEYTLASVASNQLIATPDDAHLSADGGLVVFTGPPSGGQRLWLRDLTAAHATQIHQPGTAPRTSGDGGRVAYHLPARFILDDRSYVYLWDAATGARREIGTPPTFRDSAEPPVISRDGSAVAFMMRRPVAGHELWVRPLPEVATDPLPPVDVLPVERVVDVRPAISGDGRFVAYVSDWKPHLFDRTERTDAPIVDLPEHQEVFALELSDDGQVVAMVVTDWAASPRTHELWVIDRASGQIDVIADIGAWQSIALSGDGRAVAFSSWHDDLVEGDANGYQDIFVARRADIDDSPPTWPDGAALRAEEVGTEWVRLGWDAATDDTGVTAYRLLRDGDELATLDGATTSHTVTDLAALTSYRFKVTAGDASGNWSEPLVAEVTTRAAAEPGEAALSAAAEPGGVVRLHWDPAPAEGLAGYRVFRATADAGFEPVADVAAPTTTHADEGLPAATTARYLVMRLDETGAEHPHTVEVSARTPDLPVPLVTWTAQRLRFGHAALGEPLQVTVTGEPGRHAEATIGYATWFDGGGGLLDEPRPAAATAELEEDPANPGTYRGAFPLTDGTASVTEVTVRHHDGAGHETHGAAGALPVEVSGGMAVTLEAPDGVEGLRLAAGSASAISGQWIAPGTPVVPATPAGDWWAEVTDAQLESAHRVDGLTVRGGLVTPVTLRYRLRAALTVEIRAGDGGPAEGWPIRLQDPATGTLLASTTADASGRAVFSSAGRDEDVVRVTVQAPVGRPLESTATLDVTLVPGAQDAQITVPHLPAGHLEGTVLDAGGGPITDAHVTVTQHVDGRDFTFRTTTGDGGHYALDVLAGLADVTVTGWGGRPVEGLAAIAPGDTATLDLTAPRWLAATPSMLTHELSVTIWSKTFGHDWRRWDLGDVLGLHTWLRPRLTHNERPLGIQDRVPVMGEPGDTVELCADGINAGLPAGCTSRVLADDAHVALELRLEQVAAVRARIMDGDRPYAGRWTGLVAQHGDPARAFSGFDDLLEVALDPGEYQMTLCPLVTQRCAAWSVAARFTVLEGDILDLGVLEIQRPGAFTGGENAVLAVNPDVAGGGLAEVRSTYELLQPVTYLDAAIAVEVPPGTELAAEGVLLDGRPATGELRDGRYTVPLDDLAPGALGTLRHHLRLVGLRPGADVRPRTWITWQGFRSGGAVVMEPGEVVLGVASVRTLGVTIEAPDAIDDLTVALSGRAPAGSKVSVYDGRVLVAAPTASPAGLWRVRATLPDRGAFARHRLSAAAVHDGTTLHSREAIVVRDPTVPRPRRVTIAPWQQRNTPFEFDAADGVARFPLGFWPGETHRMHPVTVAFDHGERVESPRMFIHRSAGVLDRQPDGTFRGEVAAIEPGPFWLAYDVVPGTKPLDVASPGDDQLRGNLPPEFADFEVDEPVVTDPSPDERHVEVSGRLPSLGGSAFIVRVEVTGGVDYTPTVSDLRAVRKTGAEVYGVSVSGHVRSDEARVRVTGHVPEELLQGGSVGTLTSSTALAANGPSVASSGRFARISIETRITAGTGAVDVLQALATHWDWQRLFELADLVDASCDDFPFKDWYHEDLEEISDMLGRNASLMMGTTYLASRFGALGGVAGILTAWGAAQAFNWVMDHQVKERMDSLEADVQRTDAVFCKDEEDSEPPDEDDDRTRRDREVPIAEPVWIHDPSGFVYEAVESNRLEAVTATVLEGETSDGPWEPWDAEWFGQVNPMPTDETGWYGWDVPEGWWHVVWEADGYETARSRVLRVLPPHTDVDVGLVRLAPTEVELVEVRGGEGSAVEVTFDSHVQVATVDTVTLSLVDADGVPVPGTVVALDAEDSPEGVLLARRLAFVPSAPLAPGQSLVLTVDEAIQNYAGRLLAATTVHELVVPGDAGPADPQSLADCMDGGWREYGFTNQGLCIRYVNTGKDSRT